MYHIANASARHSGTCHPTGRECERPVVVFHPDEAGAKGAFGAKAVLAALSL